MWSWSQSGGDLQSQFQALPELKQAKWCLEARSFHCSPCSGVGAAIYQQHLPAGCLGQAPQNLHEKAEPGVR